MEIAASGQAAEQEIIGVEALTGFALGVLVLGAVTQPGPVSMTVTPRVTA